MNHWIVIVFAAFGISMMLTGIIIPQILLIAFRKKLFDELDERKIHRGAVPRLGGIAFYPSLLCTASLVIGVALRWGDNVSDLMPQPDTYVPMIFAVCSMTLLYLVGIADDIVGVRYRAKFVIQIICAILTVGSGVYVADLCGLFGLDQIPEWAAWILSGFMVVYIINAVNLIDGIDGLASGLCAVALIFYGTVFFFADRYACSLVAWCMAGALLSFFYYNVFGKVINQNKIFMGDTGSLTTGMVIAFLFLEMGRIPEQTYVAIPFNPIVLAFSPLVIPLLDVIRVAVRRMQKGKNPFLPDRTHIHHKLLALGMSGGWALGVIIVTDLFFIAFNLLCSIYININIVFLADVVIWLAANRWLTTRIRRREARLGQKLYD